MSLRALPRIYRLPQDSFFLFGLRGVGKSTWIREQLPDAHRFDLLDEGLYQGLLADPGPFAGELRRLDPGSWVVLDEVQRLPGLLNEVHRFIEERGLRFALLGSSARKLRAAGVNLLGGRALWREMFPLTPEELGGDFDLERTLEIGALPAGARLRLAARDPACLRPALLARGDRRARRWCATCPGFARFLPVAGLFHGQLLNVAGHRPRRRRRADHRRGVSGECSRTRSSPGVYRPTRRACACASASTPKLYWMDPGVVTARRRDVHGSVAPEEAGLCCSRAGSTTLAPHLHGGARDRRRDRLLGARGVQAARGRSRAAPRLAARAPSRLRPRAGFIQGTWPACGQSESCPGCGDGS